jgi:uncharacterized protein YndB with AHSA1/START domain
MIAAMRIEKTIHISRPPEAVWEYVADARNDPRWCHKVDSVEQVAGDGPGPGAKYRVLHRPRPRKQAVELSMEVLEFDPPRRLRWREVDEDGVFDVVYELQASRGGTDFSQRDDIEWKISRLLYPIARASVSRDIDRQLRSLKTLLDEQKS